MEPSKRTRKKSTRRARRTVVPSSPLLDQLQELDHRLLHAFSRHRTRPVTFLFRFLCRLLDPEVCLMWGIFLIVLGPPYLDVVERIFIALFSASIMVVVVKRTVKRQRPIGKLHAAAPPDRFSFPSGHTTAAFALAICMFGVAPTLAPIFILVAALVGYARMYLGVHYPVDVLAGVVLGVFSGSIAALL